METQSPTPHTLICGVAGGETADRTAARGSIAVVTHRGQSVKAASYLRVEEGSTGSGLEDSSFLDKQQRSEWEEEPRVVQEFTAEEV